MRRPATIRFTGRLPGRAAVLLGTALLASACASSESDYYTLKTWPGTAERGGPAGIKLRTPSVPSSLDRDYIVRSDQQYKLKLDGTAAWSEPLADMIGQTLANDLQQRLPGTAVYTETGAISAGAAAQVELDVSQFADDGSGNATVAGTLSIRSASSHGPTLTRTVHVSAPMNGGTVAALVAGLSQALGQLADLAAAAARRLPPPTPYGGGDATVSPAPVPLTVAPTVPFASAASR